MTIKSALGSIPNPFIPVAGLYLVATPIGNKRDISLRALDVLNAADIVACEDTRVTGGLLKSYDIKAPKLMRCDAHSEKSQSDYIIEQIASGKIVALCSDAGSPIISDPGHLLVKSVREAGHLVTTVPGASSIISALQLSGLPSQPFTFIGFVPQKGRDNFFKTWVDVPTTLVCFERHSRLQKTLDCLRSLIGETREIILTRELTKLYEEVLTMNITAPEVKGECVIVIAPPELKAELSRNEKYAAKLALKKKNNAQ